MSKCLQNDLRISPEARGFWVKEPSVKIHFEKVPPTKCFGKMKHVRKSILFVKIATFVMPFYGFLFFGICLRWPPALPGALGGARTAKHTVLNCTCELPVQTLGSPPHEDCRAGSSEYHLRRAHVALTLIQKGMTCLPVHTQTA